VPKQVREELAGGEQVALRLQLMIRLLLPVRSGTRLLLAPSRAVAPNQKVNLFPVSDHKVPVPVYDRNSISVRSIILLIYSFFNEN
jgi:hypothetical protein